MDQTQFSLSPSAQDWEHETCKAILRVARLAGVRKRDKEISEEERYARTVSFIRNMQICIRDAWVNNEDKGWIVRGRAEKHISRIISAIEKSDDIAELSQPLRENTDEAQHWNVAAGFFRAFAYSVSPRNTNEAERLRLLEAALEAKRKINSTFPRRGPRKGVARDIRASQFLKSFRVLVKESGGRLTISRSRRTGDYEGSLEEAWRHLTEYLPEQFKLVTGSITEKAWQNPKVLR